MDGGKISVIVPCYNLEKYIEKTVQSILSQTYHNLEIILVDDGSTDNTSEIIDKLARDHMIIRAFHKNNGGVSSARFYGIEQASGEWISFVDGDDLLKPEMYSVLIENALKYKADISHCGYEMVFPDHIDRYHGTGERKLQSKNEGLKDLLSGQFVEPGLCNKLYKRNLVSKARMYIENNQDLRNMEDLLWNYYFFKNSKRSIFHDKCLYQYVLRQGSAATSKINKHKVLDPLKAFRIIKEDVRYTKELLLIIDGRIAAILIRMAAMNPEIEAGWMAKYAKKARAYLCSKRVCFLLGNYNWRLKLQLFLVCLSPKLYHSIHKYYSILQGTYHKYDI